MVEILILYYSVGGSVRRMAELVAEGVTRAWSDTGLSQKLAFLEIALSLAFFVAAVSYARGTKARGHP